LIQQALSAEKGSRGARVFTYDASAVATIIGQSACKLPAVLPRLAGNRPMEVRGVCQIGHSKFLKWLSSGWGGVTANGKREMAGGMTGRSVLAVGAHPDDIELGHGRALGKRVAAERIAEP
jgi:hypothetical protein